MRTIRQGLLRTASIAAIAGSLCMPVSAEAGLVAVWGENCSQQIVIPQGLGPVKAVAAGGNHSLLLKADGTISGLGWSDDGSLATFVAPAGLSNVAMIAAGQYHNLALKSDGTVFGWAWGSMGNDHAVVPAGLSNVTAVVAGAAHSLALKVDGSVVGWGDDQYGQCSGSTGLSNVTAVAAGLLHSLAIKADGTVAAWGQNTDGQCAVPPGLSNVTAVAAGIWHSLALRANGTVVGWGANWQGQLDVPAGLSNVTAIAAGAEHSLALRADGTVVAWGGRVDDYGQGTVPAGLANVKAIAAGAYHNVAIASDGPLQILSNPTSRQVPWRTNVIFSVAAIGGAPLGYQWLFNGQALANTSRFSGATSANLTIHGVEFADIGNYVVVVSNAFGSMFSTVATLLVTNPPVILQQPADQTISAGSGFVFMVVPDGTPPLAFQWSFNGIPVAGATSSLLRFTNVQSINAGIYAVVVSNAFGCVRSTNAVLTVIDRAPMISRPPMPQTVLLGRAATFTVGAIGSLPMTFQWRRNGLDISGATGDTLTLPQIGFEDGGYYNVLVGNAWGEIISLKALLSVSQVAVWSSDSHVIMPTNVPPGLSNVVAIAAGNYHLLALKADGTVATWANNPHTPASLTNIPAGLSGVTAIAAGGSFSLALRGNGTVAAWGQGSGTNIPADLSGVTAIAAGYAHGLARRTNGTVTAWGASPFGETNVPAGLSNVVGVAAGTHHSVVLKSDGAAFSWGTSAMGPIFVPGSAGVIAVAAGGYNSVGILAEGNVLYWGAGMGESDTRHPSNVVAVAPGDYHSLELNADGKVGLILANFLSNAAITNAAALSNIVAIASGGSEFPYFAAVLGNGAPAFTIQPVSQSVVSTSAPPQTPGRTVRFHGRAVGVQPLRYQWQLDGVNLVGATNGSLTLTNVQGKDAGVYRVIATNALGQATSRTAILSVPCSGTLATALNATNLMWKVGISNAAWFVQNRVTHDGEAAAQSGPIGHGQQSYLQTLVIGPGTLHFWWKVSSEEGFDMLRCYQDDSSNLLASVSGETDWEQETFAIPAGPHTLKWLYLKDATVSDGQDAAWVDEVSFGPTPPAIAMQPLGLTSPAGTDVVLAVMATGTLPLTYQWLKGGLGLAGATQSRLLLPKVGRRDAGVYAVRVSNPWGSTLSSNAALFVRVPQRLGAPVLLPDGSLSLRSGDADGGSVRAEDLMGFEAQASTNLTGWLTLTNALVWRDGALWLRDPDRSNSPRRFYRVLEH